MKKKGFLQCFIGIVLCFLLGFPAFAAEQPASGQAGSSSIRVSIQELAPGYYLCAVWDDGVLLTLFDATVGSDGTLEQTVEVGKVLQKGDNLSVGISGENAGGDPITYDVAVSGSTGGGTGGSGSGSGSTGGSTGGSGSGGSSSTSRPTNSSANRTTDKNSSKSNGISIPQTNGGTVSVSPSKATEGERVTVTVQPDAGYMLDRLTASDQKGNAITLTAQGGNQYMFTMPSGAVSIDASFRQAFAALPFSDVRESDWFYSAVQYVYEKQMMSGVTASYFDAEGKMTRAMLVSVFYRMRGESAVSGGTVFTDVPADAWFTNAVAWAVSEGIVSGYGNGLFGPDDNITREQIAVILWRNAGKPAPADSTVGFADAASVSDYAQQAICWAVEKGILNGSNNQLSPGSFAMRAQVAQMLKSYLK